MRTSTPLLTTLLLLAAAPAAAQVRPDPATTPEPAVADSLYAELRGSLRALATAQNEHYGTYRAYAYDPASLEGLARFEISAEVRLRIVQAGADGFAAEVTHAALPGRSCVYWYGRPGALEPIRTALEARAGERSPGQAICDEDAGR